jgi:hypothetical protein
MAPIPRDCIAWLNEASSSYKIHTSAAGYGGKKGMLDGFIVIRQLGIPRDALARERGAY